MTPRVSGNVPRLGVVLPQAEIKPSVPSVVQEARQASHLRHQAALPLAEHVGGQPRRPERRLHGPRPRDAEDIRQLARVLDLHTAFARAYDQGGFVSKIDYQRDPTTNLNEEDRRWLDDLLKQAKVR